MQDLTLLAAIVATSLFAAMAAFQATWQRARRSGRTFLVAGIPAPFLVGSGRSVGSRQSFSWGSPW